MKRSIRLYLPILLLLPLRCLFAIEVSGSVYGKWSTFDSPVIVTGNIIVEAEKSLLVEDGVVVLFDHGVSMEINGELKMRGSVVNPIIMESRNGGYWGGIIIRNATSQEGDMRYAIMSGCNAGVRVINSHFEIVHCDVDVTWIEGSSNDAAFASRSGAHLEIDYCDGSVNSTLSEAYVIDASYSAIEIDNCNIDLEIIDDDGFHYGTGVILDHVTGNMKGCYVDAYSRSLAGTPSPIIGILINTNDDFLIDHNGVRIESGSDEWSIAVDLQSATIDLNHFSIELLPTSDESILVGIGVRSDSEVTVKNTIIANFNEDYTNTCYSCFNWSLTSNLSILFSTLYNTANPINPRISYQENPPLIYSNPEWSDDYYHLLASSPCIDRGEFGFLDPDNTPIDIGLHYYPQEINNTEPQISDMVPRNISIESVYPNPFNNSTMIRISIPETGELGITLHDILGRTIGYLSGTYNAGIHTLYWNGKSDGKDLPSGLYFIKVTSGITSVSHRLTLLR
ncbi:MAG: T9SS type A sorting domain-containing protein [Candidatus Electryonea clarkiae]|nr:T9SS type A sorting domain-containing protein [Candidatus Electryonea clarkiae]MDP8289213.1 T9SS type A sorting domain-containing protein [Candidatus Electryonea clarkiae]